MAFTSLFDVNQVSILLNNLLVAYVPFYSQLMVLHKYSRDEDFRTYAINTRQNCNAIYN